MEVNHHEMYEYARRRIQQKRFFYFHSALFFAGSVFMFVANTYLNVKPEVKWYPWGISIWCFILVVHFARVFIVDRFMNQKWERAQIDKLILKQERKLEQIEKEFNQKNASSQQ